MEENKIIFDVIIKWKIFRPIYPLYHKYREGFLYLFFGGLTFFIALIVYIFSLRFLQFHELIANIISWICGVSFSYFTTKKWVFFDNNWSFKYVLVQILVFFGARLLTLIVQEILLFVFVTHLGFNDIGMKIITEIINILLNYIVSRFIIFKKERVDNNE